MIVKLTIVICTHDVNLTKDKCSLGSLGNNFALWLCLYETIISFYRMARLHLT